MEHLFKLKNDDKETVGYLLLKCGAIFWKTRYKCDEWTCNPEFAFDWASAHPFVTKDKNGKDVFAGDEILVYRGKKNIGEGYVDFNERFLWWVVNNSNQDNDREAPQDWSQLTLCNVDIELIKDKEDENQA